MQMIVAMDRPVGMDMPATGFLASTLRLVVGRACQLVATAAVTHGPISFPRSVRRQPPIERVQNLFAAIGCHRFGRGVEAANQKYARCKF